MNSNLGWNQISKIYDFVAGKVDEKLYEEIIENLGDLDGVILDEFGCGTGNLTAKFPKTAKVRAMDYSPNAIEIARQKTGENVNFYLMDFYKKTPEGKVDKIVACRSVYNPDLSKSMETLSNHVRKGGQVIVAHPHENLRQYLHPKFNGREKLHVNHLIKSLNRIASGMNLIDYSLFSAEEFEAVGRKYFDELDIKLAGYGTHYLVSLKR